MGIAYQSRATLNVGLVFGIQLTLPSSTAYVSSTEKDVSGEERVLKI